MKIRNVSILLLVIMLFSISCNDSVIIDNESNVCYIRNDKGIAKCLELDKAAKKAYLYSFESEMEKWTFDMVVHKDEIILTYIDGSVTAWRIGENEITTNTMTEEGYKDITYKLGTKEQFNDMIKVLLNGDLDA